MPGVEKLSMLLTSAGVTSSVGAALDTLVSWIKTKPWDLDQADKIKFLDRIITHLGKRSEQVNMSLEIYGADDEDGPFVLLKTITLFNNDPQYLNDVPGQRYYVLRFLDTGVQMRWQLHGFEIFGELGGDEF